MAFDKKLCQSDGKEQMGSISACNRISYREAIWNNRLVWYPDCFHSGRGVEAVCCRHYIEMQMISIDSTGNFILEV